MKQKLKICIISGKSPLGDPGGYPAYSRTLSKILTSLGHNVYTLAISDHAYVQKTDYSEIHFLTTKLLKAIPVLRHLALAALPYYSIIFALEMKKIIQQRKIDKLIVWGMGPWALSGIILNIILRSKGKIIVITSYFTSTRHEMKGAKDAIRIKDYGLLPKIRYILVYEVVARFFHLLEDLTLKGADHVVIHYNSSRNIIKKYFKVQDKKIHQFPWYNEIFKRKGDGKSVIKNFTHPLIISVCRQDPRKGINFIIRAIDLVTKSYPNLSCFIVGSGSFLDLNKNLVKKLNLQKNIQVLGFVPDINPLLRNADIAIIVPLAQGSSALTVLEAMSFKKAIIGSDCDGIPEDIINNETGLIVKKGDEVSLSHAIIRLIENYKLRKKLGQNAYRAYKKLFGFNKMKTGVLRILSKYTTQ